MKSAIHHSLISPMFSLNHLSFGYSDVYTEAFHYGSNLQLSHHHLKLNIFACVYCHLDVLFWEVPLQVSCLFFNCGVCLFYF